MLQPLRGRRREEPGQGAIANPEFEIEEDRVKPGGNRSFWGGPASGLPPAVARKGVLHRERAAQPVYVGRSVGPQDAAPTRITLPGGFERLQAGGMSVVPVMAVAAIGTVISIPVEDFHDFHPLRLEIAVRCPQ